MGKELVLLNRCIISTVLIIIINEILLVITRIIFFVT